MVLGIRSFPDGFSVVVLEGTQSNPGCVQHRRFKLPAGATWPAALTWVRRQMAEVMQQAGIDEACIKIIEHNARNKSCERLRIEAVVQEYLNTELGIECKEMVKAQIKRAIPDFTEPARYLDRVFAGRLQLGELNVPNFQEATVAAIALLPS
ncbi:MAG: hypothetical protein IPH00_13025 [Flavobacteriales bacterium]|nr:hypothetical protein [Flavobacteriales bacterium]